LTARHKPRLEPVTSWLLRHRPQARLSLQMTIAGLAAFTAAHLLSLTQVYWAVLTAVIVTQASVGGSLKASFDRFFGTIGGAAWGVAVSVSLPHATVPTMGIALAVALIPLSAVVALSPRYRIAPVTAAIVLLGTPAADGVIEAALDRVFEIGLGSVVALAVALAVRPSRAHLLLFAAARDVLTEMSELTGILLSGIDSDSDVMAIRGFHDRIRAGIEGAVALADEAARERASHVADAPDPEPLLRNLRRLSHDLVSIARTVTTALPEPVRGRLAEPAKAVAAAFAAGLDGIGAALIAGKPLPSLAPAVTAAASYGAALQALRRDGIIRALPDEDVERVYGLAFALEQMRGNLEELAARAREAIAAR
jgi:uncharacterized membrane protein YccC